MKKKNISFQRKIQPGQMKFWPRKLQQTHPKPMSFIFVGRGIDKRVASRDPSCRSVSWQHQNHKLQKTAQAYSSFPDFNQTTLH